MIFQQFKTEAFLFQKLLISYRYRLSYITGSFVRSISLRFPYIRQMAYKWKKFP